MRPTSVVLVAAALVTAGSGGRTLAVLLLAADQRSIAMAAAVVGASSLGAAVAAPLRGRLIDRRGVRRVLMPMLVLHLCAWWSFILLADRLAPPLLLSLATLAGISFPPVYAVARSRMSAISDDDMLRRRGMSHLSATQSTAAICGPPLAGALAGIASPGLSLFTMTILTALSVAILVAGKPSEPTAHDEQRALKDILGPLRSRRLLLLLLVAALIGAEIAGLTVLAPGVVDAVQGRESIAGLLLGVLGAGQAIGALAYGRISAPSVARRCAFVCLLVSAVPSILLAVDNTLGAQLALFFLAGLLLAPSTVAMLAEIDEAAPQHQRIEAFAWVASGQLLGWSVGSSLVGVTLAHSLWLASGLVAALALLGGCVVAQAISQASAKEGGEMMPKEPAQPLDVTDDELIEAPQDQLPANPGDMCD